MAVERKASGRFMARACKDGKRISLGTFDTEDEARAAVDDFKYANRPLRNETNPYRDDYRLPGKTSWDSGTADAQKKQEYNRTMGEFADMLADPDSADETKQARVSRYLSNLAEDEKRFLNRRRARSVSLAAARELLFVRRFIEASRVVFKDRIEPSGYASKSRRVFGKGKRIVNVLLSDLHFGARLDASELPTGYTAKTEARRLAKIVAEVCDYKPQYRDETTCNVLVNGDIIEGYLLHDIRDGDPLTDQFTGIVYALTQAIGHIAAAYPRVQVYWQSGNHGRNKLRHPGRATSSKWDSFETMAGVAVRLACQPLKNVVWNIPTTPYCTVPLFDARLLLTHGDTVINVGNPGKSLNLAKIDQQMAHINATGVYGSKFDVFAVGHVHVGVHVSLMAGHLIVNPPLVPSNGFALTLGYVSQCGQWLWESVEGYPVGDARLIEIGAAEDRDASLEKIIKPARFSYDP